MKFLPASVERSVRSLNPSRATGQIEFRPESRKRAQPVLAIPFETILYASAMGVNRRNGKLLTSFLCTKNSKRQAIKGRRKLMLLTLLEPSTRSPSVVCFTKLRDMDSREASSNGWKPTLLIAAFVLSWTTKDLQCTKCLPLGRKVIY